jgi:hypothetical protein
MGFLRFTSGQKAVERANIAKKRTIVFMIKEIYNLLSDSLSSSIKAVNNLT